MRKGSTTSCRTCQEHVQVKQGDGSSKHTWQTDKLEVGMAHPMDQILFGSSEQIV